MRRRATDLRGAVQGIGPIRFPDARERVPLRQQVFDRVRAAGHALRTSVAGVIGASPAPVGAATADLISMGLLPEEVAIARPGDVGGAAQMPRIEMRAWNAMVWARGAAALALGEAPTSPIDQGMRRAAGGGVRVVAIACLATGAAVAEPRFEDRSHALPVEHVYSGGREHFVGGGVAVLDCNGDALPDLVAAGGTEPARLFVNRGGFGFEAGGGLPGMTGVTGLWPLDIDGDGATDLAVLRVGANRLLRGDGACRFADGPWDVAGGASWSTAFAATWMARDVLPTLAIGNYVDRDDPDGPFGTCDVSTLHRPEGDRYGAPVALQTHCALSMLIADWRRDGRRDLRVSNDRHYYIRGGHEQMFRLDTLTELGEADGWPSVSLWGMGIASRDITGDGVPEVMSTSMGDQLLQIWQDGAYVGAPFEIGTYAQRPFLGDDGRPSTGWHAEWGDVDNDGRDDLFIAKGNVDQMPSNAARDPNNLLMQRADGTFAEAAEAAGVATVERARGAALADLDLDGRLDLVVVNRRAPMELYRNVTEGAGNWLAVVLAQPGPNRHAVGAWIEVDAGGRTQWREVTVGGGHGGGQAGPHHFGLGGARTATVRVHWPDGVRSDRSRVAANRMLTLHRGR